MTNAGSGWILLRAGGHDSSGLEIPTVRTEMSTPSGPVRLALGQNGEARVLLPLSDRETPSGLDWAPSLGVTLSSFTFKGREVRFLDLICLAKDLESVFVEVVDEMLARIGAGATGLDAAQSTIEDFRALLMRSISTDRAATMVAGLVAELLVLNRLLDRSSGAWRSWRGPAGDRHDFRCGNTSLEVKASLRAGGSAIINGLEQLEPPSGGSLHLLYAVVESVAGGTLTISALGHSAVKKADDPDRVRELLGAAGCGDADAAEWNRHSFRLESETLYEVVTGFPRLTPSMLTGGLSPAGVSGVSYRIDLSVGSAFVQSPECYANLEEELSKCL